MSRPSRLSPIALAAATALVVAACGNATPAASPTATPVPSPSTASSPTPAGSADVDAVYAEINEQVRAIRGLDEKKPIAPTIVSPAELSTVIRTTFDHDYPPAQVAADEQLYKGLGLIPMDADLERDLRRPPREPGRRAV